MKLPKSGFENFCYSNGPKTAVLLRPARKSEGSKKPIRQMGYRRLSRVDGQN